jgi:3-oxoacyl-[acyl-carrier protein] reductase
MDSKQVALVTGASRGIGRATAIEFAKRGWAVAICARDNERLLETRRLCEGQGRPPVICLVQQHDIRDSIGPFLKEILAQCGRIDTLVNNAGVLSYKPFMKISGDELRGTIETNLTAQMELSKEVLPHLLEREHGTIINVISNAGEFGFPNMAVYCASKHGLVGFTKALATEMKVTKVKIIGICPSGVDTEMHRQAFPEVYRSWLRHTILAPDNVARRIVDFGTDTRTRNGQIIDIDPWHTNLFHKIRGWFQ